MIPADTSIDAYVRQVRWLRRLSGPQRLALVLEMCDESRELAACGVRSRRPDFSELQVCREVNRIVNELAPTIR